jgi:hypothetical protein
MKTTIWQVEEVNLIESIENINVEKNTLLEYTECLDLDFFKITRKNRNIWYARDILYILGVSWEEFKRLVEKKVPYARDFFICERNSYIDFCGSSQGWRRVLTHILQVERKETLGICIACHYFKNQRG